MKKKARKAGEGKPGAAAVDAEQKRAERNARLVKRLFDSEDLLEFITNAVMTALHLANLAKHETGVEFWQVKPGNIMGEVFDMPRLAELLRVAYHRRGIEVEPERDLAGLISAVLKHPDTPREIYLALRREIATMTEPDAVNEDPDVLRVALAVHKAEAAEEGGA